MRIQTANLVYLGQLEPTITHCGGGGGGVTATTSVEMVANTSCNDMPNAIMPPVAATATKEAINAYSIAVAPRRSARSRATVFLNDVRISCRRLHPLEFRGIVADFSTDYAISAWQAGAYRRGI
jgi:hypothetical protein